MTTGKTGFERLPLAFLAAMTFLLPGYGSPSSVPPAGTVEVYETPDIYQLSNAFTLTANGTNIPVIAFLAFGNVESHYAHMSFDGQVDIRPTYSGEIRQAKSGPEATTSNTHKKAMSSAMVWKNHAI